MYISLKQLAFKNDIANLDYVLSFKFRTSKLSFNNPKSDLHKDKIQLPVKIGLLPRFRNVLSSLK